jgi:hypothetical protein
MKTRLYDEYEGYVEDGSLLWRESVDIVLPIVVKYKEMGYSIIDIQAIVLDAVEYVITMERTLEAMRLRKQ